MAPRGAIPGSSFSRASGSPCVPFEIGGNRDDGRAQATCFAEDGDHAEEKESAILRHEE